VTGFDNGTAQGGVYSQAKQFGSILRGTGPPVPQGGLVGDLYIDTAAWVLHTKRSNDAGGGVDPWGHYLFAVPPTYQAQLKWFSTSLPDDSIGVTGDYCLSWAGFGNYGLQPSIYGPKNASGTWPESGNGPTTTIAVAGAGFVFPLGLFGEGAQAAYSNSTQLIVAGLVDEYVLATPVSNVAGTLISELGLQSVPSVVTVTLNPLYTAEDEHSI
jgi:hypothetical protein